MDMVKVVKFKSILTQVAVLFIIGILVTGFLAYLMQHKTSYQAVKHQTETRAEEISEDVTLSIKEYRSYEWLINYWYENYESLDIEYDAEFTEGTETEKKALMLNDRHPGLEIKYADSSTVEAMPEEDQKLFAEVAYSWITTRLNNIKRTYHVDYLFVVLTKEPFDRQFFVLSASDPGAVRGTNYEEVYPLGTQVTVSESQQEAMKMAGEDRSHLADAGDYVDYYALFGGVEGNTCLIGMTFNLTSFMEDIGYSTLSGMVGAMVTQIILALICMGLIYQFILNPLKTVQENIRLYKEKKNSETVIKNLSEINSSNEIGLLSEDVADLAREIDEYLLEIESITAEKERIGAELDMARRIQASMMPDTFPAYPDRREFDIYASMDPAKEVGGDFYDFFLIDEDHLCMVIADVSGKGIPAALFMMVSKIILQSCAMLGRSAGEILTRTNEALCSNNQQDMFVTVWVGILELSTGKVIAANGGHEYPALKRGGGNYEILKDVHGIALGALDGVKYKEYTFNMEPGDKIFLYTDGVPEADDGTGNMFGMDRMKDTLNRDPEACPEEVLNNMTKAVEDFVGGAEQFDDLTMLCVSFEGNIDTRGDL